MENNKRLFKIIGIILSVLLIIWVVYLLIPVASIKFETAPQNVNIKIGDKSYKITNGEKINISPGKYSVIVSCDGFENYKKDINLKNHQDMNFIVVLIPKTDAAKKLLDNPDSQNVIFHFGEQQYTTETDQLSKKYPILKVLPIYAKYYSVYPCGSKKYPGDTTKLAVCVDYTAQEEDLKPYVIKDIKSRGYNLNGYEVIWQQQ